MDRKGLVLLPGGRAHGPPAPRPLARGKLRLLDGKETAEMEQALTEAVEAAKQIRQEIQQRIARALESINGTLPREEERA